MMTNMEETDLLLSLLSNRMPAQMESILTPFVVSMLDYQEDLLKEQKDLLHKYRVYSRVLPRKQKKALRKELKFKYRQNAYLLQPFMGN